MYMKLSITILLLAGAFYAGAQKTILINNVQIFNGRDEKTTTGNVLIIGNVINKISTQPIATPKTANVSIMDGKGKFLMPGLIDAHTHVMMESLTIMQLMNSDIEFITVVAAKSAEKDLMQGFTTFRDLAGPAFGLQKPLTGLDSGAAHLPFRRDDFSDIGAWRFSSFNDVPRDMAANLDFTERFNFGIVADGKDQVLKRVREQLRLGATQIKLAAGGEFHPVMIRLMCRSLRKKRCLLRSRLLKTGALMLRCMPIRQEPFRPL